MTCGTVLTPLPLREGNRTTEPHSRIMSLIMKRTFILVALLLLLAADASARPNIIVIMVDDMGFAGPSCEPYNNPHYKTPGMDRLAAEGMRFTDFHSSGTVCSPTRAGLLTGRYQQRAGIEAVIHPYANHPEHMRGLHDDEITFAEQFKAAGYATGLVGKWHLGYAKETPKYHPMNHGFDYFMGYVSGNIDYINHWGDHMQHDWWHGRKETTETGYTTHLINRYALEFIKQNKDKPFCLYIAHESPHSPVQGPNDPIQRGPGAKPRVTPYDEAMKQMILEMDKGVAQVRDKIVKLGLDKNTYILFFSDNGDAPKTKTGSPRFRGHKGQVYEGGTRVPAIAWAPGKINANATTDELAITLDVMPTILSLAGIDKPKKRPLDGIDLSPVLLEGKSLPSRPLYWASLSNNGYRSEALRDGKWKLVVQHTRAKPGTFENESVELYDLDKDEGEKNNIAAQHRQRAADMLKRIKAWYADTQKTASPQPGGWLNHPGKRDDTFFNRKNLTGWKGNEGYWSVKGAAIVGHSDKKIPRNEFIWSDVEVKDFYLVVDVKLTPDNCNAGIQFRSKPVNASGQAVGYQADVGAGVWGKLYHEHGRGKLDWNDNAKLPGVIKRGEWNRYEILAIGHRIWTVLNGKLCVAIEDPKGELSGKIAFQIHGGPPQTTRYRVIKLVHNPPMALSWMNKQQLLDAISKKAHVEKAAVPPLPLGEGRGEGRAKRGVEEGTEARRHVGTKGGTRNAQRGKGWTPQVIAWRKKLDVNDPGFGKWNAIDYDDSKWKTMNLPGFFEGKGLPGFDGTVWYRKEIKLPKSFAGKDLTLELGPIDDMDMTWFNGVQVGGFETPGYWLAHRKYTVPGKLVKAGRNVITVRAIDHGWGGGFGGRPGQMKIGNAKKKFPLAGPWRYKPGVRLQAIGLGELTNPPGAPLLAGQPASKPAPDLTPLLRPLVRPDEPVAPFEDGFTIEKDQTIVIMGGTNAFESVRFGYLESLMSIAFSKQTPRFRNLAWQADTVYQQQRPRNFFSTSKPGYGEQDGRPRSKADVFFFWMGQMESLPTTSQSIDEFVAAYNKQLDAISDYTGRIVLVTPVPFDDPLQIGFDLKKRNDSLAEYCQAIEAIGRERKLPVVNLFRAMSKPPAARGSKQPHTHNGIHLSDRGHQIVAETIASQLGFGLAALTIDSPPFKTLREKVHRKNELWFAYWRPTNWAFLYGNRQTQPSSRDHKDRNVRWFPEEIKNVLPRLRELEADIHRTAQQWSQPK